jgi:glucan 1,3-beta-glucosidase
MGMANAQRTLNLIRTLGEFISQEQYSNLIPIFSILNEPVDSVIGATNVKSL